MQTTDGGHMGVQLSTMMHTGAAQHMVCVHQCVNEEKNQIHFRKNTSNTFMRRKLEKRGVEGSYI